MSIRSFACLALAASEIILAGCQGGQPTLSAAPSAYYHTGPLGTNVPIAHQGPSSKPRYGAGSGSSGLYVAQGYFGTVNEYEAGQPNAKPFCQFPVGSSPDYVLDIGVDARGNVWVPEATSDIFAVGKAFEFSSSCALGRPRTIVKTLDDPQGQSAGIAFDSAGTAYVDNIIGPYTTSGSISIYSHGATSPTGQLNPPTGKIWAVYNMAVDGKDNVYFTFGVDGFAYNQSAVEMFPAGSGTGTVLNLKDTWKVLGIAFDARQNMVLADAYYNSVFIFAPPYSGQPTHTIVLHDGALGSYAYVSLNKANTRMYLDNLNNNSVEVYSYPAGKYLYSITDGIFSNLGGSPTGIALDPRAPN